MRLRAVIGAQYGDEGKGLLVDAISGPSTLVVRYNGGAQAGHTVVTPEGQRHEFHHLGAGTYRGARTLLSRFFIVNPIVFREEWDTDGLVDALPTVYVDSYAPVSTPWDMMLNQAIEQRRNDQRHGSCGMGINETVLRTLSGPILHVVDLLRSRAHLASRLHAIRNYAYRRATEGGVTLPPEAFGDDLLSRFVDDCDFFTSYATTSVDDVTIIQQASDVVFEGAQGLRLDEQAPDFPHVTRSRTGLPNVMRLLSIAGIDTPLDVYYVTRAYVTRHGAGPLADELPGHPWCWDGPETNDENEHQGKFRYARFTTRHLAAVASAIMHDARVGARAHLVVTCLDQCKGGVDPLRDIARPLNLPLACTSYGPTREHITWRGEP